MSSTIYPVNRGLLPYRDYRFWLSRLHYPPTLRYLSTWADVRRTASHPPGDLRGLLTPR